MIASKFSLDHRLAELRPSESELRAARARRDASSAADVAVERAGRPVPAPALASSRSHLAVG